MPRFANLAGRVADYSRVRRNSVQYDTAGANLGTFADFDVAEDFCPGADHYAAAHLRVAVTAFLSSTAQGHTLENGYVITYFGSFANDNAGCMIEHDAAAYPAGRVDIDGQAFVDACLDKMANNRSP